MAENKPLRRLTILLARLYKEGLLEDDPSELTTPQLYRALAKVSASPKLAESIREEIANAEEGGQNEMIERAQSNWTETYGKPGRFGNPWDR